MRIKNRYSMDQEFERREFKEGLDYFLANCQRQGVDLKKDPEKKEKGDKVHFSINNMMTKIREKTELSQLARKEKIKRTNKMFVESKKSQEFIEKRKKDN